MQEAEPISRKMSMRSDKDYIWVIDNRKSLADHVCKAANNKLN